MQRGAGCFVQGTAAGSNPDAIARIDASDTVDASSQRRLGVEHRAHRVEVGVANLEHRAGLLAEQRRDRIGAERCEIDVQSRAARERHLQHARGETAVGAVVVRRRQSFAPQAGQRPEQRGQRLGPVEVGGGGAEAFDGQRESGSAEAICAVTQIDQKQ